MAKKGRPQKYSDVEELRAKIQAYFLYCDSETRITMTEKGPLIQYKPYTVSGLCLYLDITRETLSQYEQREDLSDTIKKAKGRIENWVEEKSLTGHLNPTVSIFNLKNNFGWKDKQDLDIKSDNTNHNIDLSGSEADLIARAKEIIAEREAKA